MRPGGIRPPVPFIKGSCHLGRSRDPDDITTAVRAQDQKYVPFNSMGMAARARAR